jgi:hypothetical protein
VTQGAIFAPQLTNNLEAAMTKAELLTQLEAYDDDAQVEVSLTGIVCDDEDCRWHGIEMVTVYEPHTPEHALLALTDEPTMC